MRKLPAALSLGLTLLLCMPVHALVINGTDAGWYSQSGIHVPESQNYGVAYNTIYGQLNNFFVFDLAGVAMATTANLRVYMVADDAGPGGYTSPNSSELWSLFDVTTDIGSIVDGTGGVAAFEDFESGVAYGQLVVTPADQGTFVEVPLNSAAVSSINATSGLWALGGTILEHIGAIDAGIFARSHSEARYELVLRTGQIPTPTSHLMFLLGLGLLLHARGKRAKTR